MKVWTWIRKNILRRVQDGRHRAIGLSTMEEVALTAAQTTTMLWEKNNDNTQKILIPFAGKKTPQEYVSQHAKQDGETMADETRMDYSPVHLAEEVDNEPQKEVESVHENEDVSAVEPSRAEVLE